MFSPTESIVRLPSCRLHQCCTCTTEFESCRIEFWIEWNSISNLEQERESNWLKTEGLIFLELFVRQTPYGGHPSRDDLHPIVESFVRIPAQW